MHAHDTPDTPPADPVAAVTHADPYPYYAALRSGPPMAWHEPLGLWVASRADVVETLLASAALRVRPAAEPVPRAIAGSPAGELFGHLVRMNDGVLSSHGRHKAALQRALAGLNLTQVRAEALRVAQEVAGAPLSEAIFSVPLRTVAHLLGFANQALPQVERWTRDFVACLSPLSDAAQLQGASSAAAALMARFEALVAMNPPRHATLLAGVLTACAADAPASRALLANLVGLLSQTCDASAGLLGNSLIALARQPELRDEAARRPDALLALVQETARHDPSVQNTRRFMDEPLAVQGIPLAAGDTVLVLLAAANRDPTLNPEPDRFMPARVQRRSLGFSHGVHACPGEALACTLAAAGLQALLPQPATLDALRARGWHYRPSTNARIPVFH